MRCRISDLFSREVINICDGRRLGCVCDAEVEIGSGRLIALVVPGDQKLFGFSREKPIVIPWECVTRFGDDVILAECREIPTHASEAEGKRHGWFS